MSRWARVLNWVTFGFLVVGVVVGALIFVNISSQSPRTPAFRKARPRAARPEPLLAVSSDVQDHAAAQAAFVHLIKDVCCFFERTAGDAGADVMGGGEV